MSFSDLVILIAACVGLFVLITMLIIEPILWNRRQKQREAAYEAKQIANAKRFAAHEVGHLICAWKSAYVEEVESASIHETGGRVYFTTCGTNHLKDTVEKVWDKVVISLAGIAAEMHVYGDCPLEDSMRDIIQALKDAHFLKPRQPIIGFSEKHPPAWDTSLCSQYMNLSITSLLTMHGATQDVAPVHEVLNLAYARAHYLIVENEQAFNELSELLVSRKELSPADCEIVLGTRTEA